MSPILRSFNAPVRGTSLIVSVPVICKAIDSYQSFSTVLI